MIFRQMFDADSSTYTYLVADSETKQACLIDPVLEKGPLYAQLIEELDKTMPQRTFEPDTRKTRESSDARPFFG